MSDLREVLLELSSTRKCLRRSTIERAGAWDDLVKATSFLRPDSSVRDRVRCVVEGLSSYPKCPTCGGEVRSVSARYCSPSCAKRDPEVQRRYEETCSERFGETSPMRNRSVSARKVDSTEAARGWRSPFEVESVRKAARETIEARYGKRHRAIPFDPDELASEYGSGMTCSEIADRRGVSRDWVQRMLRASGVRARTSHRRSRHERELVGALRSLGLGEIVENDRRVIAPLEIDAWIPEHRLGVEVHGLHWHGDERDRHRIKYERATAAGIGLVQVFDVEWVEKRDLILDVISARAGRSVERIGARECVVERVDPVSLRPFMERNHLSGYASASTGIALVRNGRVMAAATLRRPRFDRSADWELVRVAHTRGTTVVGGLGKMVAGARRLGATGRMISYCDRRFFSGRSYLAAGFTHVRDTSPGYYYFGYGENYRLLSRYSFQKGRMARFLPGFDPDLTEVENATAAGFRRVWDCGHGVYELRG